MTLILETPDTRSPEREYIFNVLLTQFLGLDWEHKVTHRSDVRLTHTQHPGEIRFPDILFSVPGKHWLSASSMPERPLPRWDTSDLSQNITLICPTVPIIYGDQTPRARRDQSILTLPLDIFGSSFFMLTRYEELVQTDKDEHDRFPAYASLSYQENFLDRPIVDEYVEILWAAISGFWPNLRRKKHQFRTLVSCDVDSALMFRGDWAKLPRILGTALLKHRSPMLTLKHLIAAIRVNMGNLEADPHWSKLKWIMEINESANNSVTFFFIPEITDSTKDNPVSLNEPKMRHMLKEMHQRNHEIGLHPGYKSFRNSDRIATSARKLREVMEKENIDQNHLGSRQHFLRWDTEITPTLLHENNLYYDSSLGFADHPGFRCGTCREYPLFSIKSSKKLKLNERPLIIMDQTLFSKKYKNLSYNQETLSNIINYKKICKKFSGDFTILWHNSHLNSCKDRSFYKQLIK